MRQPATGSAMFGFFPAAAGTQASAGFNPAERQKRIKLDQLNLNIDKALAQLRGVKQQVAEANAELQQAHGELATMNASTLHAVQEVREQQDWPCQTIAMVGLLPFLQAT